MGTTAGGMMTGLAEALYRGASPIYALFIYGAVCAVVGLCCLPFLALVPPHRRPKRLGTLGMTLTIFGGVAVIGRFLLIRDVFAESVGSGTPASALAVVLAVMAAVLVYSVGRGFSRNFRAETLDGLPAWSFVGSTLICFALLATRSGTPAPVAENAAIPSTAEGVILVVADTLRADALTSYGAKAKVARPATPKVHAWASQSVVFDDMSAQASWTKPAMATMLSSRHAEGHQTMLKSDVLPDTLPTLAENLKAGGILTGAVVTNYNVNESYGFEQGFDHFQYLPPDRYLGAPPGANELVLYNLYRMVRERFLHEAREARFFYQEGDRVNLAAFEFLDANPDEKFFLWLHYMEPHDPYFTKDGTSYARVASPNPAAHEREIFHQAYGDDVERFDNWFGQLLRGLEQRGRLLRTHIILTSDHGEEFAEHGGFYHGQTLYEEMLQVPLILGGPSVTPARRADVARQIDIAPSVSALLGIQADVSWEGRNLLGDTAAPSHTFAAQNHQGQRLESVRVTAAPGLKLITANADNPRGLAPREHFATDSDPKESANLHPEQNAATQSLEEVLGHHREDSAKGGAQRQARSLQPEDEAELRALGYIE